MINKVISKFLDKFIVLDNKTIYTILLVFIFWAPIYVKVVAPWLYKVGGRWGLTLVGIGVPGGCSVLILIIGTISKILQKNKSR